MDAYDVLHIDELHVKGSKSSITTIASAKYYRQVNFL